MHGVELSVCEPHRRQASSSASEPGPGHLVPSARQRFLRNSLKTPFFDAVLARRLDHERVGGHDVAEFH